MRSDLAASRLVLACLLCLAGCREALLHDLGELEANRAITRLQSRGISARKTRQSDGKWTVTVDDAIAPLAIKILDESRASIVPQRQGMERSSFFASREEQLAHAQALIAAEIERTLMSFGGVLEARVHLSSPRDEPGFPVTVRSAGVLVVHAADARPERDEIAALVAGASGTEMERVTVAFRAVPHSILPSPAGSPAPGDPGWGGAGRIACAGAALVVLGGWLLVVAVGRVRGLRGRASHAE